jgi:hypothetical protein
MPYLNPVPGSKIALQATWFKSVRDRIEEIKPLEGNNIKIIDTSEGKIISVVLVAYNLTVCQDGAPGTLIVYGPSGQ